MSLPFKTAPRIMPMIIKTTVEQESRMESLIMLPEAPSATTEALMIFLKE